MNKTALFLLILLSSIAFSLSAQTFGDVNNDSFVDIIDALLVAQYYVGLAPSAFTNPEMADVNCDSTIDIVDALLIAQFYVGLIPEFDCPTPTQDIALGNFTWAVIVDLDSEPVTQVQAQELVGQASDILMELTGFTFSMVDFGVFLLTSDKLSEVKSVRVPGCFSSVIPHFPNLRSTLRRYSAILF